jgi:hypothetical protein
MLQLNLSNLFYHRKRYLNGRGARIRYFRGLVLQNIFPPNVLQDGKTIVNARPTALHESNLYTMFNPTHWHYISDQTPEEVVFMKMFDSNHKVQASCESSVPNPKDVLC